MGDISAEPSMEEILSSIKRIIAEEGDAPGRHRRQPRPVAPPEPEATDTEVLELNDPIPVRTRVAEPVAAEPAPQPMPPVPPQAPPTQHTAAPMPAPQSPAPSSSSSVDAAAEPIVSAHTAEVSRGSLEALTRKVVKPEPGSDHPLEGVVREMLRPMLRDWLDAHLPQIVEGMVAREIARITAER